jgi:hypothetical protein
MAQALTMAVAVHPAAPLGKTEPGQVFRKKVGPIETGEGEEF